MLPQLACPRLGPKAALSPSPDLPTRYCGTSVISARLSVHVTSLYAGRLGHIFLNAVFFEGFFSTLTLARYIQETYRRRGKRKDFYWKVEIICARNTGRKTTTAATNGSPLRSDEHVSV